MKVVLMTVHMADSARKVNFHFWVEQLLKMGMDVDFVTVGFSHITKYKRNARQFPPPYNSWVQLDGKLRKFVWRPYIHPFSLGNKFLDFLISPIVSKYPYLMPKQLIEGISNADLFIIENGAGLLLVPRLKRLHPNAKIVYSVCDRIETLGYHPLIVETEKKVLPLFDLIRVPSEAMLNDYDAKYNVKLIPQGLDKSTFDKIRPNPYETNKNVISVGDMLFDAETVRLLADNFPDWTFHLFGKKANLENSPKNVIAYGERPFEFLAGYIQHADIGLAPYRDAPNADYLSQSSLKMMQYSYCRLPIVAPKFAASGRSHVCGYESKDDKSKIEAMKKSIGFDKSKIDQSKIIDSAQSTKIMLEYLTL